MASLERNADRIDSMMGINVAASCSLHFDQKAKLTDGRTFPLHFRIEDLPGIQFKSTYQRKQLFELGISAVLLNVDYCAYIDATFFCDSL